MLVASVAWNVADASLRTPASFACDATDASLRISDLADACSVGCAAGAEDVSTALEGMVAARDHACFHHMVP